MYTCWEDVVLLSTFLAIYLVCGNTMCVSTCQVDYILLRTCLAIFSLLSQGRFLGIRETSQFWQELSCLLTTTLAEGKNSAGTTAFTLVDRGDLLTAVPGSEFLTSSGLMFVDAELMEVMARFVWFHLIIEVHNMIRWIDKLAFSFQINISICLV